MEGESLERLRRLLAETRVVTVALVIGERPVAGLLPFLASRDLSRLFVHVSRLARHTRGLDPGATFSAVVHEPDRPEGDPLRIPRLLLEGHVEAVEDDQLDGLRRAWEGRFASASMTLGLGDFSFRALAVEKGRLISGFAQAERVGPEELALAARSAT